MEIRYLGLVPYWQALEIMESVHEERVKDPNKDGVILVVQHPPTVTMGKRELYEDMLVKPEELKFKGIAYHKIDRGGSVTVHEPGQAVIYPILNIDKYGLSVRNYVNALEEAMIQTCAHFKVTAARDSINPGVWVGIEKVGAVGIRFLNKVTKHGIAFNVINTLDAFSTIVPCGLHGRGVTSLQRLNCVPMETNSENFYAEVEKILAENVKRFLLGAARI